MYHVPVHLPVFIDNFHIMADEQLLLSALPFSQVLYGVVNHAYEHINTEAQSGLSTFHFIMYVQSCMDNR